MDSGHRPSRHEDRVEHWCSVASFTFIKEMEEGVDRADATIKCDVDKFRRLQGNDTRGGGVAESCIVKFIKKWSEMCRSVTVRRSMAQLQVRTRSRSPPVLLVGGEQTCFKSK